MPNRRAAFDVSTNLGRLSLLIIMNCVIVVRGVASVGNPSDDIRRRDL